MTKVGKLGKTQSYNRIKRVPVLCSWSINHCKKGPSHKWNICQLETKTKQKQKSHSIAFWGILFFFLGGGGNMMNVYITEMEHSAVMIFKNCFYSISISIVILIRQVFLIY